MVRFSHVDPFTDSGLADFGIRDLEIASSNGGNAILSDPLKGLDRGR